VKVESAKEAKEKAALEAQKAQDAEDEETTSVPSPKQLGEDVGEDDGTGPVSLGSEDVLPTHIGSDLFQRNQPL